MSPVKTSPFDPAELVARCIAAGRHHGFRVEPFATVDGVELVALTRRASGPKPRIYLSSGIHGDEPAPPLALLELLEAGAFDDRATWFLVPLLNPTGFHTAQRDNRDGIDLNRDYLDPRSAEIAGHVRWLQRQPRFDLAICLHEDWESVGYYLYELNPKGRPSLSRRLLSAATRDLPVEPGTVIDGRPIDEPGIIRPESDPALRETWPEAIYLRHHHTDLCYTVESPSAVELTRRVASHVTMVEAALADDCLALYRPFGPSRETT